MQLHKLQVSRKRRKRRIGRGGKRGTYSGRGLKGQKSRAGRRIRPAIRDLILRLPKKRGFNNKSIKEKPTIINIKDIVSKLRSLSGGQTLNVDKLILKKAALLSTNHRGRIKILGGGEIDFPISVRELSISKSAKIKIEKAGGKIAMQNKKIKVQSAKSKLKK